jgi:hypothetical protein
LDYRLAGREWEAQSLQAMAAKGKSAWLVTWDTMGFDHWGGEHGKIVAVLPPRFKYEHVRAAVVALWCNQAHSDLSDRIFYALDKGEQNRMTMRDKSDCFCEHFRFGRKPYLYARKVTHLRYVEKAGVCTVRWRETSRTYRDPQTREWGATEAFDASWSEPT